MDYELLLDLLDTARRHAQAMANAELAEVLADAELLAVSRRAEEMLTASHRGPRTPDRPKDR